MQAQTRELLQIAPECDSRQYGVAVITTHVVFPAAAFSGRLCQHVKSLGGRIKDEECEGYVHHQG